MRRGASLSALARECVPSTSIVNTNAASSSSSSSCFESKLTELWEALRPRAPPRAARKTESRAPPGKIIEVVVHDDDDDAWTWAFLAIAAHARADDADVAPTWSSASASTLATTMFRNLYDAIENDDDDDVCAIVHDALMVIFQALDNKPKEDLTSFRRDDEEDVDARALVAARQLHFITCAPLSRTKKGDVKRISIPCVLRAMDYPSHAVKMYGIRCAARISTSAEYSSDELAPLLAASRDALIGATPKMWPYALESACNMTVKIAAAAVHAKGGGEDVLLLKNEHRETFTRVLDTASLHAMDVKYAAPALAVLPSFMESANLFIVPHLSRIFPLLCAYLQSVNDDVSIGAANAMRVAVERAWPRVGAQCATTWPELKRAYAEADARSAKKCDELRRALERVSESLQLAAGEQFSSIWSADPRSVPEHARGLVSFLSERQA
jgi:hypothetical protein